jgi:hypothetical protein
MQAQCDDPPRSPGRALAFDDPAGVDMMCSLSQGNAGI